MKEYQELSDEISKLFYESLEMETELTSSADDVRWTYHGYHSDSAKVKAFQWFESRRDELILSSGWTVAEYDEAEKKETDLYYQSLEAIPDMVVSNQDLFIHMDDDCEPEVD